MNLANLKTIIWLRWRLMINQMRRVGRAHRIVTVGILVLGGLAACGLFLLAWLASGPLLAKASPPLIFLMWCGLTVGFLFGWSIGLITDLQRSEPLSLNKFLHMPVSPKGAFLTNFVSSFVSFSMILMFPILLGFSLAMIRQFGLRMTFGIVLLLAFVLTIGALTYQLRGWLGAIMVDKKKRRTVIAALTFGIIFVSQIPNLLNLTIFREAEDTVEQHKVAIEEQRQEWREKLNEGEISRDQFIEELESINQAEKRRRQQEVARMASGARIACLVIPFGWFPLGMESLASGNFGIAWLALFGLLLLTSFSLHRSYQSTLRLYRGQATVRTSRKSKRVDPSVPHRKHSRLSQLVERRIPGLNNHQSSVATGTIIGVMRAPEAKLALLTPFLIMCLVGVSFAFRESGAIPAQFRAFTAIGVATFAMFGIMQLLCNQFGYDRSGFRCLVLSPVQRVDILIGKNMAYAPFALGIGGLGIVAHQIFFPMPWTHLLATVVQMGSIYLVTCLIANLMAIYAPLAVASGTMKPMNLKLGIIVLQLLITMLLPIGLSPVMIPPAVDLILQNTAGAPNLPWYLILATLLMALVAVFYRLIVRFQARMLFEREKNILATVTQVGS